MDAIVNKAVTFYVLCTGVLGAQAHLGLVSVSEWVNKKGLNFQNLIKPWRNGSVMTSFATYDHTGTL